MRTILSIIICLYFYTDHRYDNSSLLPVTNWVAVLELCSVTDPVFSNLTEEAGERGQIKDVFVLVILTIKQVKVTHVHYVVPLWVLPSKCGTEWKVVAAVCDESTLSFLFRSPWTRISAGPSQSSPFGFLLCAHTCHTFHLLPPLHPPPSLYPAAPVLCPSYRVGHAFGLVSYWANSSSADCCSNPQREVRCTGSPVWKGEAPWIPWPFQVHFDWPWWSWQKPGSHSDVRECSVSLMRISLAPAGTAAPLTTPQDPQTFPEEDDGVTFASLRKISMCSS